VLYLTITFMIRKKLLIMDKFSLNIIIFAGLIVRISADTSSELLPLFHLLYLIVKFKSLPPV